MGLFYVKIMANKYKTSTGKTYTQAGIKNMLSKAYQSKHQSPAPVWCEGCNKEPAQDNDHTIAQKRCKELHLTELIWDENNFVSSCRKCHQEWESWKSGAWAHHRNALARLEYLYQYDKEAYNKRSGYDYGDKDINKAVFMLVIQIEK